MDGWVKTQNNNSYIYNVESYNSVQQKEVSIFQLFVFLFQTQYRTEMHPVIDKDKKKSFEFCNCERSSFSSFTSISGAKDLII